jgi:hypothetical protein
MSKKLNVTAWAYDTSIAGGTYVSNLSFNTPSQIDNVNISPLYSLETVDKYCEEVLRKRDAKLLEQVNNYRMALKQVRDDMSQMLSDVAGSNSECHYARCANTVAKVVDDALCS